MPTDARQQLIAALQPVSAQDAQLAADPETEIRVYPAPFLKHYRIYALEQRGGFHPTLRYIGFAPGKPVYLLPSLPDNFVRLARADGLRIDSPETAVTYIAAYLEVTRPMSQMFYALRSADEIRFFPDLTADEEQTRQAFLARYGATIAAPQARATAGGYEVTVYTTREQAVERHVFAVSRDGGIKDEATILERDLPLVYGG